MLKFCFMKRLCICLILFISIRLQAQEEVTPTAGFTVEGAVKAPMFFALKDLDTCKQVVTDSVVIYNHLMQRRRIIRNISGVLLKNLLERAGIDVQNPKLLSEFYFTCIASDGYKVVFSWNELFNAGAGNYAMIITAANGKKGTGMDDRTALVCTSDYATGRRYVRGLQKIIISRVP